MDCAFLWPPPLLKVPGSEGFLAEAGLKGPWERGRVWTVVGWREAHGLWAVGAGVQVDRSLGQGGGAVWGPKSETVPVLEGPGAR